ncbi:hypothetical protein DRN77_02420 [Methanosarcinales archaeon]|nr:MAG: hypothetical protein DRN77_02420 [Methanosarcinales archaeon]
MTKLIPCKHLDYDESAYDAKLMTSPDFPDVKYWYRTNVPYDDAPRKVQFCKLRGRINGIFACYTGEMSCYEPDESNGA